MNKTLLKLDISGKVKKHLSLKKQFESNQNENTQEMLLEMKGQHLFVKHSNKTNHLRNCHYGVCAAAFHKEF